jgi:anti-sigma factor ChrR (cupin superfamily)
MKSKNLPVAALIVALAFIPVVGAQDKAKAPAAPAATPAPAAAPAAAHKMWAAKDLDWKDLPSIAGAKIALLEGPMNEEKPFIARIKFAKGVKVPPHWHPGIEHVTVISGTFAMAVGEKWDDKAMHSLGAGDVMIMQPKTPHYAQAKTETVAQIHGMGPWSVNYINPADDPSKKAEAPKKDEKKK